MIVGQHRIKSAYITSAVCAHYGLTVEAIMGPSKRRQASIPRQVAMYLIRRLTDRSFPAIAAHLGRSDHITVLHGVRAVEARMATDPDFAAEVGGIEAALRRREDNA